MTEPTKPDGYCKDMSGDWKEVPEWAIKRLNFLEERVDELYQRIAPLMDKPCPESPDMSCWAIKMCYPYCCEGTCGKCQEIYMNEVELDYWHNQISEETKEELSMKAIRKTIDH